VTLIKIHNPILRIIAGFLTLVLVIGLVVGLFYGAGRLALRSEGQHSFIDYFLVGLVATLCTVAIGAIVIMTSMVLGDGITGHWLSDILAGLGILVVLYGVVFGILHLLGRLVVLFWPALRLGPGFMDYACGGIAVLCGLGALGGVLWLAYLAGERFYDP
jgi:hypothetical protein